VAYSGPALLFRLELKMAQGKVSMPSGMGGLMRYFDEYKSKIRIKPGHIIVMCVVVMAIMVFLYVYGNNLLGL
jgi:preprotein translocase subunit Sec61beta